MTDSPRARVLRQLHRLADEGEESVSSRMLADRLGLEHPRVQRVLERLKEQAQLELSPHEGDVWVRLTQLPSVRLDQEVHGPSLTQFGNHNTQHIHLAGPEASGVRERIVLLCRWHSLSLESLKAYLPKLTLNVLNDSGHTLRALESEGTPREPVPGEAQLFPKEIQRESSGNDSVLGNLCAIFATQRDWVIGANNLPGNPQRVRSAHDLRWELICRTIDPLYRDYSLHVYLSGPVKTPETLTITVRYQSPTSPFWRPTEQVLYGCELITPEQHESAALAWALAYGMSKSLPPATSLATGTAHRLWSGEDHPMSLQSERGVFYGPTILVPVDRLRSCVDDLANYFTPIPDEQRDEIMARIRINCHLN